jgi:hypothetical protein
MITPFKLPYTADLVQYQVVCDNCGAPSLVGNTPGKAMQISVECDGYFWVGEGTSDKPITYYHYCSNCEAAFHGKVNEEPRHACFCMPGAGMPCLPCAKELKHLYERWQNFKRRYEAADEHAAEASHCIEDQKLIGDLARRAAGLRALAINAENHYRDRYLQIWRNWRI